MFTRRWLLDTTERVLATAIMAGVPAFIAVGFDDWRTAGGITLAAAGGSLVKAVAGTQVGNPESASVLPTREP